MMSISQNLNRSFLQENSSKLDDCCSISYLLACAGSNPSSKKTFLLFLLLPRQLQQLFHLHSGLDQAFIDALPLFLYKELMGSKEPIDCVVCLCKFSEQDKLRSLPLCSHAFHIHCIDTLLLSNSTCPLCRVDYVCNYFDFQRFKNKQQQGYSKYKVINGIVVNYWAYINFSRTVPDSAAQSFCHQLVQMCQESGMEFKSECGSNLLCKTRSGQEGFKALVYSHCKTNLEEKSWNSLLPFSLTTIATCTKCETDIGLISQCCPTKYVLKISKQYLSNVSLKINVKVQRLQGSSSQLKGTMGTLVMIVQKEGWKHLFSVFSVNHLKEEISTFPGSFVTRHWGRRYSPAKETESGDAGLVYLVLFHIWQKRPALELFGMIQARPIARDLFIRYSRYHILAWLEALEETRLKQK
ncbi:unnamed protein product [Lactuca saligna]|uniref:RING-type domain-containing protein n=1 Tax=Lactuca saligna TaxID=75948 RepID=A0AA36E3K6_LACSI|nr:unnamed protein product [Lactuca saligna]